MRPDGCTCGTRGPADGSHLPGCPVMPFRRPDQPDEWAIAKGAVVAAVVRWHGLAHKGAFDACREQLCYFAHPLLIR